MKIFMCFVASVALAINPSAYAVDQISIGGSGFDLGSTAGVSPFANLSLLSLDAATITLELSPGEVFVPLTIQAINGSGEDWVGVLLEADGGIFATAPASLIDGSPAVLSSDATSATLTADLNAGGFTFLSANLTPSSDPIVVSLTPITTIPTPASAAMLLAGVAMLLSRRTDRG